jgi:hypothetical protein
LCDPVNSSLATGDIVSTGTLTRAFPILAGERWRQRFMASSFAAGLFGSREPDVASLTGRDDPQDGMIRQPRRQGILGQILPKPRQRCL